MNGVRVALVADRDGCTSCAKVREARLGQPWHREHGFTLVELLVVVAVMLILLVMTVQVVDFTFTQERLKAGARQVQSALEGARDRAIFAAKTNPQARVGIRFLTDETDPRIVTSMIYIGMPDKLWDRGRIRLERVDDNADGIADLAIDTNGDNTNDATAVKIVRGDAATGWFTLKERGLLGLFEDKNLNGVLNAGEDQNGNGLLDIDPARIEIPANSGIWYPVLTHRLTPVNQILELATPYQESTTTLDNEVIAFQGTGPSTYRLELQPRVLPEAQPILLPETVCIDLDGSLVPSTWRPGSGSPQNARYSSHMDILFSPRGVVTGPVAAMGLVHLYVAERKDVQKTIDVLGRPPVNSNSAGPLVPGQNQFREDLNDNGVLDAGEDLNGNGVLDEASPIGQQALISIFTLTGKVSSYGVDTTDVLINATGTSGVDGYADRPFRSTYVGEVTNQ
jgi:prepilin-type N-terminal cleavage/methylation domain-containing protein